ncbi:TetR/AcrR family transcriptional regulator [Lentilactobacillus otakiensis]|uniref:TetR/AcrR family transcriptional regulator n=1 Tax=Lentilactobacillus otakiensis TaxID=481720 RepID=UPI003D1708E6
MVSTTFTNLSDEKQTKIRQALLKEFSEEPLATAQVAPIVKTAGIARGAFYKYFDDLTDAYKYLYGVAMRDIHSEINNETGGAFEPQFYLDQVDAFVEGARDSQYFGLIKMHLMKNESLISQGSVDPKTVTAPEWATMILSHEAIKQIIVNPDTQREVMSKLSDALNLLAGKGNA